MSVRKDRMADEIRDLIAVCFSGGQMRDPRLEGVTITHVKVSPDYQVATVYFRVYGEGEQRKVEAKAGLESASGFFRKKLADALDVRRVPTLRFFFDESIERGSRIEDLLRNLD